MNFKTDRLAIIWIAAIILAVNIGIYLYSSIDRGAPKNQTLDFTSNKEDNNKNNNESQNANKNYPLASSPSQSSGELFEFDPNTADSSTFVRLGLRPNVARAIIHYREAGGKFHTPNDLARIYTLSQQDFERVKPYIRIDSKTAQNKQNISKPQQFVSNYNKRESTNISNTYKPQHWKSPKLKEGQTVDIATADSVMLMKIPGVGSYYAAKIVRYRERMGGFTSIQQLKEIQGLPEDITHWTKIGKPSICKLKINELTFGKLLRHPYLNYEQVCAIFNYRRSYGHIHSFDELKNFSAFNSNDLARLTPYIDFSE